jgi:Tfp pilus assembly protein PilO
VKKQKMPKWAPFALVGLGGIVGLAAGWLLILSPKQQQVASLNKQTQAVQQQIAADLARASTARGTSPAPTIRVADIYKLQTAMPSTADAPDLLLELDQTAKAAGVQLTSVSGPLAATTAQGAYSMIPISLVVSGNFYAVTDLLYRLRDLVYVRSGALEANGRIFTVNSVTLSPNGNIVNANISLDTYVYGTVPGAASAAATGSTTPTDTTTDTTQTTTTTSDGSSGPSAAGATP